MSGRKNGLRKFQIFTSGSMAGNLTSTVSNIEFLDNIAIQLVFTGTPVGLFSVEGSVDHVQDQQGVTTVAGTWTPLVFSEDPVAAGAAGNILFDMNQLSFPWIRVVYTRTSGSGTLNGFIAGKMV